MLKLNLMTFFVGAFVLSGCVSVSDRADWDCGSQEGFGCSTISQTANRILGGSSLNKSLTNFNVRAFKDNEEARRVYAADFGPVSSIPKWEQNDILKIHIQPFVDGAHSYHERSVIYSVVSQGGWARQ